MQFIRTDGVIVSIALLHQLHHDVSQGLHVWMFLLIFW